MTNEASNYHVIAPATRLFTEPDMNGSVETEALYGESVSVLGEHGPFYKIAFDLYATPGYVFKGDIRRSELHRRSGSFTHRVIVPRANIYTRPSFKFPEPNGIALPMNALVRITEHQASPEGDMARVEGVGWLFAEQVARKEVFLKDYVALALAYVGPMGTYTWGGRAFPDCSGLVQQVLIACGISCPRNVGEQMQAVGREVATDDHDFTYRRGDLVFFRDPGLQVSHVVIMTDAAHCVHASIATPTRAVAVEPLQAVVQQQFKGARTQPTMVRRFPNR